MQTKNSSKLFASTDSFDVELTDKQKKIIKAVQAILVHTLTAEEESEFFEATNTLLKKTLEAVHDANYPKISGQPHLAVQAIEYSMDFAQEIEANDTEYDN